MCARKRSWYNQQHIYRINFHILHDHEMNSILFVAILCICDVHILGPIRQNTQIKIGVTPSVDSKGQHTNAYDIHNKSSFYLQRYKHYLCISILKYKRKMTKTIANQEKSIGKKRDTLKV